MTTRDYQVSDSLKGPFEADVAVIGGGLSGLSAAHFIKKEEPGLRIVLLESRVVGSGATGRSGGLVSTRFGINLEMVVKRLGRQATGDICRYMRQAGELLAAQISRYQIDCEYEPSGFLRVAASEKYKERLLRDVDLAASMGFEDIQWLDRIQLMQRIRSPLFLGAARETQGGLLNPAKFAWGWKEVIEGQGVRVFEYTPMVAVDRQGPKIRISVPWGEVLTDKVIVTMNAYSGQMPGLRRKQMPLWTYAALSEPLRDKQLQELGWAGKEGVEEARPFGPYYRLTPDGRILIGGGQTAMNDENDADQENNEAAFMFLEKRLRAVFPALQHVRFAHQWGGLISVPMDMMPALGYWGDKNMIYSLGCMGHGLPLAHLNGSILADLVLGRRTHLTDLAFVNRKVLSWPPEPLGFLARQATQGYFSLYDRYCRAKTI